MSEGERVEGERFGPYRLEAVIGRGGMGEVFRAYDTSRDRVVAIKRLPRELAADPVYRTRFQRESALVANLHEPHVIPIHDYGEIDGQLFIDMRLVEGPDLAAALRSTPMSVQRAVDVISQIADALDAAHAAGLVHRDVKPSNILLVGGAATTGAGERGVAYLVDFGIARAVDGPTLSHAGLVAGSIGYMAPERFTGEDWDLRVDVYSLACVLHECLVGHRPFPTVSLPSAMHAHITTPPPRPSREREGLDPRFDDVIATGMAKDPDQRYPSAGALAAAARDLLTSPSVTERIPPDAVASWPTTPIRPPDAAPSPPPPPPSRRRMLQVASGVAALAALGAGTWGGLRVSGVLPGRGPWAFRTGDKVYSSPLVAAGVVYVGSNDGLLYALDAGDGGQLWSYAAAGAITSSPALDGGVVYVGSDDRRLHAVDAATGAGRWTVPTGVIHSSPAVADGIVVVGTRNDAVIAVDAATGRSRWRFAGDDWFNSSPRIAGGIVYIGCRDRNVYAVDLATGRERWRSPTGSSVDSSAAVSGDTVHIGGDDGRVRALSAVSGAPVWEFAAGAGVVSSPRIDRGVLFVGCDDAVLYALEQDTGRERWRYRTGGGIRSSPAVVDGVVYVGSQDRFLHAVDALTGAVRWRFPMPAPVDDSSPAVADGLVFVGCLDGTVYAVDAATGAGPH
ncbi:PQQ-binding-like beta-propeller repeat protein [Pseudonocardia sp. CA-107938]|uniref:outer membrane protein assembly factor BamB family protein n=1 Tax=Pseudonocardia sp. CA-107938 TaxID=3240021 RepID=UPI003D904758